MKILFVVFFIIFLISLIIVHKISIYKNHKKATGGMINYDSFMRKFVYKVPLSRNEIISLLKMSGEIEELTCDINIEKSTIVFSEYGSHRDYYFYIQECDGYSILRLEQVAALGMRSDVPFKLNPFIVGKLEAEVLPFSQYGF